MLGGKSSSDIRRWPQPVSRTTGVVGDGLLHRGGDAAAVDIGHAEIGDHGGVRLAPLLRGAEGIDRLLAAAGLGHHVAVGLEQIAERFQEQRIVIHQSRRRRSGAA